MDYKIKKYGECPIKYENGQAFIDYINENRHLLKDRPQVYQHGDYHIGNMMIDRDGQLHVIDFNRNDYGDPWEEFNRIVWCAQKAPLFASGTACPLAFGETGVKSRIKSVLNYKKPAFWLVLAAVIASVAVAVCFLTTRHWRYSFRLAPS